LISLMMIFANFISTGMEVSILSESNNLNEAARRTPAWFHGTACDRDCRPGSIIGAAALSCHELPRIASWAILGQLALRTARFGLPSAELSI
jgi:hypothetical protein